MSFEPQVPGDAPQPTHEAGPAVSDFADGGWHRMHPLTPLMRGGLAFIVIVGVLVGNLRERLIQWVVTLFVPDAGRYSDYGGDPVDWVLANNALIFVLLAVIAVLVLVLAGFWLAWRFHEFRITGEHVEVRKGILFRSHRRAPLDRVQGVNLTRPFPARLIGMAKLEVVGAGTDANVDLEYLATTRAESVRVDILRLASGARRPDGSAGGAMPMAPRPGLADSVSAGVTGIFSGVDLDDVDPASILRIPTGRLVGSQVIKGVVWLAFFALLFLITMAVAIPSILASEGPGATVAVVGVALGVGLPLLIGALATIWAPIARSLRYSIAPTADGVRTTFGLATTVTETIPPGRIFAVELSQPLLWRPFGWWTIKINRMSGKSLAQQQSNTAQQFNTVLPVGKREDVEWVLRLILPDAPPEVLSLVWEHGVLGPVDHDDPYTTMAPRARWRRPLSWKRHGIALTPYAMLVRRGRIWRTLGIFPLVRQQGFATRQGPLGRAQRVASLSPLSITGPVYGHVVGIDRDAALALGEQVAVAAAQAVAADKGHRWAEHEGYTMVQQAPDAASGAPTIAPPPPPPGYVAPVPPPPPASPPAPGRDAYE